MSLCLIGLGSNEGDRHATLVRALEELGRRPGIHVLRQSQFVETAPVGGPSGQGPFLNAASVLETSLDPSSLLHVLLEVETALGRRRTEPWGPRTIDLDLLLYEDVVCSTATLALPHPRMAWRRFVLEPAAEVAPNMIHPTTGWTISRLLEHLNTAKNYLAIAGPVAVGKTELARQFAQTPSVRWLSDTIDIPQLDAFYANPAGNAWATGLEFVSRRALLLAADSPAWRQPARVWVSDYWFGQCLAFARVWLPSDRWPAFEAHWEEAARGVVRPKLIVLLDRPTDQLLKRVGMFGQPTVACWTREALNRLREALDARLRGPDVGPVLRLVDQPPEQMFREILAAAEAMR